MPGGTGTRGRQHSSSAMRSPVFSGPDDSESSSMNLRNSTGCFSNATVFGRLAISSSRGRSDMTGTTVRPLRNPYAIEIVSGLHGSGIMSLPPKTPDSLMTRSLISESTIRCRSLSKLSLPAGILHRLEGDAAHAAPFERLAHNRADLVVVHSALDSDHQRGR